MPHSWDVVCSRHFVSGEPSTLREDVDYRPTLLMKGMDQKHVSFSDTPRNKRACKRASDCHMRNIAAVCQDFIFDVVTVIQIASEGFKWQRMETVNKLV
jgi:hypothetical protein